MTKISTLIGEDEFDSLRMFLDKEQFEKFIFDSSQKSNGLPVKLDYPYEIEIEYMDSVEDATVTIYPRKVRLEFDIDIEYKINIKLDKNGKIDMEDFEYESDSD